MGKISINEIALSTSACPICLLNEIEARGIDTFSSRVKFDQIIQPQNLPSARNPRSFENKWIYYCDEHDQEDLIDNEIEIEDLLD